MTSSVPPPVNLQDLLAATAALHHHLCPRQVLGVRSGLAAAQALGVEVPQADKRLLAIVETDGCFADGVSVATNCWLGRRTLRVEDYGKVALTLVDTHRESAVRVSPRPDARAQALRYAPEAPDRWTGQLLGYQLAASADILVIRPVRLRQSVSAIISQPGVRVTCIDCGEEVMNGRERATAHGPRCAACAGERYYEPLA